METLDIHIQATTDKLGTVLQVLDGYATFISATPVVEEAKPKTPGPRFRYVGGKHNKGIKGLDLALQLFTEANGKTLTAVKVGKAFGSKGFAPNSASSVLTTMTRDGVIEKVAHGVYRLKTKAEGS